MQRVALVVIESEESRSRNRAIPNQSADNAAASKCQLIRISEIELAALADSRRTQRQFPTTDSGSLHVDREEHIGIVQAVVIEEVGSSRQKVVGIQHPAFVRNGQTELVLFIAFARQRHEV